jgi:pilus assembly protein CpaF
MRTAVDTIEAEVRDLVRRRGLDPVLAPADARGLVEEAVADYARRAVATATLPPLGDRDRATRVVLDAVAGFGPLQRWLDDPAVEEIWVNEPGRVYVARSGRPELTTTVLTADGLAELVERMLRASGRRLDLSEPFVDATLPDGSRLHVVIPDVTRRHPAVNVRKFVARAAGVEDLVRLGMLPAGPARFLAAAVVAGLNVLVSGGTQAGKTTVLGALLGAMPARQRLVTVEEVFELRPAVADRVAMQTRPPSLEGTGEVTLRRLVREALRMRPDRLVVGEVRQAECLDLLLAMSSGVPAMCTVHADSGRAALQRVCTLPLLAGPNIPAAFTVPTVAACVDLVVHLATAVDGTRRVAEVLAVPGRTEAAAIETTPLYETRAGRLVRAAGHPDWHDRFARHGLDLTTLLEGA